MLGSSTPRMELEGATMDSRVALRIVHALVDDPPGQVMFVGDSQTILASRERDKVFLVSFLEIGLASSSTMWRERRI